MRRVHAGVDHAYGVVTDLRQRRLRGLEDTRERLEPYLRSRAEQLYPAPPSRPNVRGIGGFHAGPFAFEDFELESAHEPLAELDRQRYRAEHAPLHRFRLRSVRMRSRVTPRAMVYMHPWMMPTFFDDFMVAPVFAQRLDCDVFIIEQPHHHGRQLDASPYSGAFYLTADMVRTAEAIRQAVMDARTVVQHLLNLGTYDQIGVSGISLGGAIMTTVACVEPRIQWAVPIISAMTLVDVIDHAVILRGVKRQFGMLGVSMDELRALDRAMFGGLKPAIAHERMLVIGAEHDRCIRASRIRQQLADWPGVRSLWLNAGHMTCAPELYRHLGELREFLDEG